MYQFVNRFLSFPPFFCRKVGFSSCASLTQLPSSRKAVLPRFAQRSEVLHGHGNLVSASHEATARAGKGDDRSFGPCRIREDKGHSSCPVYTVRSVGRGANSQGMASGHGRPRALLGCLRAKRSHSCYSPRAGAITGSFFAASFFDRAPRWSPLIDPAALALSRPW